MTDQVTPRPWRIAQEMDGLHAEWNTWIVGSAGFGIAVCNNQTRRGAFRAGKDEAEANARHIVKCVNNHDRLVEALREVSELDQMSMENAIAWLEDNCQDLRTLLSEIEGGE